MCFPLVASIDQSTRRECYFFFSLAVQPPYTLASDFQFHDHCTDGRIPWTSDQLVARPLPKHRTTQAQSKHLHIPNIHAFCGIRTHDPGFRASEDSTGTCLRVLGYRERQRVLLLYKISTVFLRPFYSLRFFLKYHICYHTFFFIWFVRLLALRPLLAYCASLGW
jgi:hypothetical protein